MVSGSVGARVRRNYTVYGDTVNAAQRREALNNDYGTRILVSDTTAQAAGTDLRMRAVGELGLRGRSEPVRVFEVLNPTPSDTTVPAHQTNTRGGEV